MDAITEAKLAEIFEAAASAEGMEKYLTRLAGALGSELERIVNMTQSELLKYAAETRIILIEQQSQMRIMFEIYGAMNEKINQMQSEQTHLRERVETLAAGMHIEYVGKYGA